MGKSTISMAIFNSKLLVHQRVDWTTAWSWNTLDPWIALRLKHRKQTVGWCSNCPTSKQIQTGKMTPIKKTLMYEIYHYFKQCYRMLPLIFQRIIDSNIFQPFKVELLQLDPHHKDHRDIRPSQGLIIRVFLFRCKFHILPAHTKGFAGVGRRP